MASKQDKSVVSALKRLIFIYGDKGGVGKSAVARLLLDIYRSESIPCKAIDSDTSNADLYRCYKRVGNKAEELADGEPDAVERIDFTVRGEADYLIDSLGDYSELILVDLPARSRDAFTTFIRELDLLNVATESGYRVTIVHVVGKTRSSVSALKEVIELCGDAADYVVVKNLLYGEAHTFTRYDASQARKKVIEQLGGKELNLQEMFWTSWDVIEDNDLPFCWAADAQKTILQRSQRTRAYRWLADMTLEVKKASKYLGLGE
jgi:hypothetical protein